MMDNEYKKLIERIQPKAKFNLDWYKGSDVYSDGDIEEEIVNLIAENNQCDFTDAIADHMNWATYYHLTSTRQNILNWYSFKKNASVLEIGCGFGAITGMLCEKCEHVTAVELSKRRAIGNLLRCRDYSNLEIIVGNLNDIEFAEKYDYITLIGVLEYQGTYTNTDNPYRDFLRKVKSLLKEDGKLLIAIENQYGLKYWCGAPEDHTGVPFDGMNQYTLTSDKIRTFSRDALGKLIKDSGYKNTFFYYPLPDYKLPTVIYSDEMLPKDDNFRDAIFYYTRTNTMVAQEERIYKDIISNDVFPFFANSFLVECSDDDELGEVVFASISERRFREYRIGTKITNDSRVIKYGLYGDNADRHLEQLITTEQHFVDKGLKIAHSTLINGEVNIDFIDAPLLEEVLLARIKEEDKAGALELLDEMNNQINNSSDEANWEDNILYSFDVSVAKNETKYGRILETGYLDMIAQNAFFDKGEIIWYDQEWILENVPAGFVMYRALNRLYGLYTNDCAKLFSLEELAKRYGILEAWKDYALLERLFRGAITDEEFASQHLNFAGNVAADSFNNIKKLLET